MLDIAELGRTSRMYSELSQRTEPTLSDVRQALVDAGQSNILSWVRSSSRVGGGGHPPLSWEKFHLSRGLHIYMYLHNYECVVSNQNT